MIGTSMDEMFSPAGLAEPRPAFDEDVAAVRALSTLVGR